MFQSNLFHSIFAEGKKVFLKISYFTFITEILLGLLVPHDILCVGIIEWRYEIWKWECLNLLGPGSKGLVKYHSSVYPIFCLLVCSFLCMPLCLGFLLAETLWFFFCMLLWCHLTWKVTQLDFFKKNFRDAFCQKSPKGFKMSSRWGFSGFIKNHPWDFVLILCMTRTA